MSLLLKHVCEAIRLLVMEYQFFIRDEIMTYPTVVFKKKIHAVKNETTCLCGMSYRFMIPNKTKELFKPIHFRKMKEITCKRCKCLLAENSP